MGGYDDAMSNTYWHKVDMYAEDKNLPIPYEPILFLHDGIIYSGCSASFGSTTYACVYNYHNNREATLKNLITFNKIESNFLWCYQSDILNN